MARTTLYLLVIALVAPWLYDRYLAFFIVFTNRPDRLPLINNFKSHEIRFRDRIRNCEDVVLDEGMGLAILSCDAGRDRWNTVMGTFARDKGHVSGGLYLFDYAHADLPDAEAFRPLTLEHFDSSDFHPLGIEFEPDTSTLYVINHKEPGSIIEVFSLSVTTVTATHVRTFKHDLVHSPNSIQSMGNGKIFFTNDHYFRSAVSKPLSVLETWSGAPGGSVIFVDLNKPDETIKTVARVPFANGIALLNSSTLVVSSTSKSGVYFYNIAAEHNLQARGYTRVPASTDNISVDKKGRLLIAGHAFPPGTVAVAKQRANCYADSEKEEERAACESKAPSYVGEWTEEGGLRTLYQGLDIGTSSTAVRDTSRSIGIVTGLYDRGIMVFKD